MARLATMVLVMSLAGCAGGGTMDGKDTDDLDGRDTDVVDTDLAGDTDGTGDTDVPGDTDTTDTDLSADTDVAGDTDLPGDTDVTDTDTGVVDTDTGVAGPDADHDGWIDSLDCSPNNPLIHQDAIETCDGADNDCDPTTHDGDGTAYWAPASGAPGEDLTLAFRGGTQASPYTWTTPGSGELRLCPGIHHVGITVPDAADVTITGVGGRDLVSIDDLEGGRVLLIGESADVVVDGLTLKGGTSAHVFSAGVARVGTRSTLELNACRVADSYGDSAGVYGGAIVGAAYSSITLLDTEATDNEVLLSSNGDAVTFDSCTVTGGSLGAVEGDVQVLSSTFTDTIYGFFVLNSADVVIQDSVWERVAWPLGSAGDGYVLVTQHGAPSSVSFEAVDSTFRQIQGTVVSLNGPVTTAKFDTVTVESAHATGAVISIDSSAALTVTHSTFDDLVSDGWGAFNHYGGTTTITDSEFLHSSSAAGVLQLGGTSASITSSTFTDCSGGGNGGGAVYTYAATNTISDSTFNDNRSVRGGALFIGPFRGSMYSTSTVSGCTFDGNSATASGGGAIFSDWADVEILNSTFTHNSATGGGGAVNHQKSANISGSTFTDNTATGRGGALSIDPSWFAGSTISTSTFLRNDSGTHGGAIAYNLGGVDFTDVDLGAGADDNSPEDLATSTDAAVPSALGAAYTGFCNATCD